MIKIEKNIPVAIGAKMVRAAMERMVVGDSFLLPDSSASTRLMLTRLMRIHENSFVSRTEAGGVRVWRIA